MPHVTVARLAELCGGRPEGNIELPITGANDLENAASNDLSFVASEKAFQQATSSRAGCLIVPLSFDIAGPWSLIRAENPRAAFVKAIRVVIPEPLRTPAIHSSAVIADSASVGTDCSIGAYVTVGEHTRIGSGCVIGNGCVIGAGVTIGEDATVHANVTIYDRVHIGVRAVLHSGAVIGADGFGFTLTGDHYEKFPQIGTVEIGDDVEIGANSCIDRGALGATEIGEGTKFDNLVHVGHNCRIGRHVVVAAQTGFSGSVTVGDYAVIGGQAGIGEKAKIESKAIIGGKSGILPSQRVRSEEPVWGIPARPLRKHLAGLANIGKLPDLRNEVRELKAKLNALEAIRREPES